MTNYITQDNIRPMTATACKHCGYIKAAHGPYFAQDGSKRMTHTFEAGEYRPIQAGRFTGTHWHGVGEAIFTGPQNECPYCAIEDEVNEFRRKRYNGIAIAVAEANLRQSQAARSKSHGDDVPEFATLYQGREAGAGKLDT